MTQEETEIIRYLSESIRQMAEGQKDTLQALRAMHLCLTAIGSALVGAGILEAAEE